MKLLAMLLLSALAAGATVQSEPAQSTALTSLVETERAFARTSVAQGRREAFLAFFGDDAIFFTPEPVKARPAILGWPVAGTFRLDWEPHFADVADAGDLGYTTGPFVRTSPDGTGKVIGTGWYFTLWRRQTDGTWKVAIDSGITSPPSGPLRPAPPLPPPATEDARRPNLGAVPPLPATDRALCEGLRTAGWDVALRTVGSATTRLYRDGVPPLATAAAVRSYFASNAGRVACEPVKDETSRSGDLGYTYGRYSTEGASRDTGYYLRIWRRQAGEWKLAIDLLISG